MSEPEPQHITLHLDPAVEGNPDKVEYRIEPHANGWRAEDKPAEYWVIQRRRTYDIVLCIDNLGPVTNGRREWINCPWNDIGDCEGQMFKHYHHERFASLEDARRALKVVLGVGVLPAAASAS